MNLIVNAQFSKFNISQILLEISELFKFQTIFDFLVTVKVAPHECVIRPGQP